MTKPFLIALLAIPSLALAAEKTTVEALVKNGKKFDKKAVTVRGLVDRFSARTSKAGNSYFLFELQDKGRWVHVYGQGKLTKEPKNADKVEVTGEFAMERKSGDRTFKVEIDASAKKNKSFGVKIVK